MTGKDQYVVAPDELGMTGLALQIAGDELLAAIDRLNKGIQAMGGGDGAAWGTDDPGKAFGDKYTAGVPRVVEAMRSYAEQLRTGGRNIVQGAANYGQLDEQAARSYNVEGGRP